MTAQAKREYGLPSTEKRWGAKKLRVRIASLGQQITNHQIKIAIERQRATPNMSLIRHWAVEIKAWEQTVGQLTRRLKKGKRHD